MKCPNNIKRKLERMANLSAKLRVLNKKVFELLDAFGVNTECADFETVFGYVQGDCDIQEVIKYVESI